MTTLEKTIAAPTQTTPTQASAQVKRRKPDSDDSPVKGVLTNLSGDICRHCDKQCTETGEQGQAIQCDLCGVWVHAVCDGINKNHYQGLVSLTSNIENLVYLCKLNSCQARFKQMIFETVKVNSDCNELHSRLEKVEAKLDKIVQKLAQNLKITAKQLNQSQIVPQL